MSARLHTLSRFDVEVLAVTSFAGPVGVGPCLQIDIDDAKPFVQLDRAEVRALADALMRWLSEQDTQTRAEHAAGDWPTSPVRSRLLRAARARTSPRKPYSEGEDE